ncbi:MAG: hypothetical protein DMG76_09645 [Acidobacteria bacterium]|nr:MAG: hypothetical protein DMG76_09645 [Acidobacteriota bacterium]
MPLSILWHQFMAALLQPFLGQKAKGLAEEGFAQQKAGRSVPESVHRETVSLQGFIQMTKMRRTGFRNGGKCFRIRVASLVGV